MKIIFATTNKRKISDLLKITKDLDIEILTLDDMNYNLGEIKENGNTLEENSLIKAKTIYMFCKDNNINYPIISDDAGLFVESLNGEPGIYTARYAEEELKNNPNLPEYECVNKVLRKLKDNKNRKAIYKCVVTFFYEGYYFQETAYSEGVIANEIIEPIKKPYFYSVFILKGINKVFNQLTDEELEDTYRYVALKKLIKKINCNR